MKTQACIACGALTSHTCESAPCCPSWACGSRALDILAADWEFVNAATGGAEAEALLAPEPGEAFDVAPGDCDRSLAALLED